MQPIICDKNAEEIIDALTSKMNNGAEAESYLEKMVKRLNDTETFAEYIYKK